MTVRVRFAPSPTGRLHVGNVRTALINWVFASAERGAFILRIDDTDQVRSTEAFHDGLKEDLQWLGLEWAETFRQSDRFSEYAAAAETLKASGRLYPCFETPEELERKRKISLNLGRPPVYDRAALALSDDQKASLAAGGRTPHWRFKLFGNRIDWNDLVRGPQSIDTASLSDPILIREDGGYLYTLPSVVDDINAKISHVVRGEDHVTNSAAQIEIFQALGGTAPHMAHTSLLTGADGQGLSKRLGSLSIAELRASGIEPVAILSMLARLGTSDNIELASSIDELIADFSFSKMGRAPARFDEAELRKLNAQAVAKLEFSDVRQDLDRHLSLAGLSVPETVLEKFWNVVRQNLETRQDVGLWLTTTFGDIEPEIASEDQAFIAQAGSLLPNGEINAETWAHGHPL